MRRFWAVTFGASGEPQIILSVSKTLHLEDVAFLAYLLLL